MPRTKEVNRTFNEEDVYRCFFCDKKKHKSMFYKNGGEYNKSKLSPICKECANTIANRIEFGVAQGMTVDSLMLALRLMDKPFVKNVFKEAIKAVKKPDIDVYHNKTVFGHYMTILTMSKYSKSTWVDTEPYETDSATPGSGGLYGNHRNNALYGISNEAEEFIEDAEINRKDCIRLIGYDPFHSEPEEDKPFLYGQMIKYLDASAESNDDAMKVSSIIQIVKYYYQADKINNMITSIMMNPKTMIENTTVLKNLQTTQKSAMDSALSLAKDNGISFAHSTNNSKGANTLSGKLKKMKELNLREIEVNAFDIGTCDGMRTVADISNASILDQIRLTENDIPDMISDQKLLIEHWEMVAYKAMEQARILLRENHDLKKYIESIGKGDELEENSVAMDTEGGVNTPELQDEEYLERMKNSDGMVSLEMPGSATQTDQEEDEDVDDDDIDVDPNDVFGLGEEE